MHSQRRHRPLFVRWSTINTLIVLTFLGLANMVHAQSDIPLPAWGHIDADGYTGVNLRSAAPSNTVLGYRLGETVGALPNGTRFVALAEIYIANGERWFKIIADSVPVPRNDTDYSESRVGLRGWVIAESRREQSAFLDRHIANLDSVLNRISTAANNAGTDTTKHSTLDSSSTMLRSSLRVDPGEGLSSFGVALNWGFTVLGTLLAVWVVAAFRRKETFPRSELFSSFGAFQASVLIILNTLGMWVTGNWQTSQKNDNVLFEIVVSLLGTAWGHGVLAFAVSVMTLRYLTSAKPDE